jgi:hypothetical protein
MTAFQPFNQMRGRKLLWLLTFLLPLSSFLLPPSSAQTPLDSTLFTRDVIAEVAPVVETLRGPVYRLELILSDDLLSLEGNANVLVTNTSQDVWNELVFRLYPNALGSEMIVSKTLVDNVEVTPILDVEQTVFRVPVLLNPNEQAVITLTYTLILSEEPLRRRAESLTRLSNAECLSGWCLAK